jgi:hypothetical protein
MEMANVETTLGIKNVDFTRALLPRFKVDQLLGQGCRFPPCSEVAGQAVG